VAVRNIRRDAIEESENFRRTISEDLTKDAENRCRKLRISIFLWLKDTWPPRKKKLWLSDLVIDPFYY
jgi:ribosome recycling factor